MTDHRQWADGPSDPDRGESEFALTVSKIMCLFRPLTGQTAHFARLCQVNTHLRISLAYTGRSSSSAISKGNFLHCKFRRHGG